MDQQSFANGWAWANDDFDANSGSWANSSNSRFTWRARGYIPLGTPEPVSSEERSRRKTEKAERKAERKRKKILQQQQALER